MTTREKLPPIFITGKAMWASVTDLNTTYDPCWTIDVEVDDDSRAVVEGAGLGIVSGKLDKEGNVRPDFVKIKRNLYKKVSPMWHYWKILFRRRWLPSCWCSI